MYIRFEKRKLPMTGEDELKLIGKNARFELSLPETRARELVPRGIAGGRMLADWRRLVVSATGRYLFRLRAETGPVRPRTLCAEQPFPAAAPGRARRRGRKLRHRTGPRLLRALRPVRRLRPNRLCAPGHSRPLTVHTAPPHGCGSPSPAPAVPAGPALFLCVRGKRRRAGARAPSFRAGKRTRPQRRFGQ